MDVAKLGQVVEALHQIRLEAVRGGRANETGRHCARPREVPQNAGGGHHQKIRQIVVHGEVGIVIVVVKGEADCHRGPQHDGNEHVNHLCKDK